MQLPATLCPDDFHVRYRPAFAAWRPAVEEVCAQHGITARELRPFADGSNLVAQVDDRAVVKIFPPFHRPQWESERRVLPRFAGALPIAVPALLAAGERDDGYTYVILERLAGTSLDAHWGDLSRAARAALLRTIGETMAAAHTLPVGSLSDLPPAWDPFLHAQIAGCRARHLQLGAPAWLIERIDDFVAPALAALELGPPFVILTGEYTPFNLLVDGPADRLRLCAMIDFGDAMVGPAVYDLLGPATFLAAGDRDLLAALFQARGLLPWPLRPAQRRGLLALLLAHRYSALDRQVRIAGWRDTGSLDALADRLFGG